MRCIWVSSSIITTTTIVITTPTTADNKLIIDIFSKLPRPLPRVIHLCFVRLRHRLHYNGVGELSCYVQSQFLCDNWWWWLGYFIVIVVIIDSWVIEHWLILLRVLALDHSAICSEEWTMLGLLLLLRFVWWLLLISRFCQ